MRQNPFARLLSYLLLNSRSLGGVIEPNIVNDLTGTIIPSAILKLAHSAPHGVSRPTLTRGKRQMSQKSRANRRKASAKARRR